MPNTKATIGILSTIALFVIALPGQAAAAGSWYVNGAKLGALAVLATTAAVDSPFIINQPAESIKIGCSGVVIHESGIIIHPNNGPQLIQNRTILACSELTPVNCTVSTTIDFEPIVGTPTTGTAPEDRIAFTPKTGKTFFTLEFKGASCAVAGEKPLSGAFTEGMPTGQTESVLQPFEDLGSKENNSLTVAGHPVFFEGGRALLKLASGSKWSFH